MEKLRFYTVDQDYIAYLKRHESKIPNIAYDKHDKFICGIIFRIKGMAYYAPISSFSKQQRTNILIRDKKGKVTSSIRLSFMFPVPSNKLRMLDISREKGFYKYLLLDELSYCNSHADEIRDKAEYIYNAVVQKADPLMKKNCCDFKKLEEAYASYIRSQTQENQEDEENEEEQE